MYKGIGDKYTSMYLAYYVHLVGIKEVTDCKNSQSGKFQNRGTKCF